MISRLGSSMRVKDEDWAAENCMMTAVRAKFQQHHELSAYLKSTAPKMLVHANAHDQTWGNGLAISDRNALNTGSYKGTNNLGVLLMKIRDEL